jgi:thioredoxin
MKKWLSLLLFSSLISCSTPAQQNNSVDVTTFEKGMTGEGVQLLDVRTAGEFNNGYLKGALQANYNNTKEFTERVSALDKSKPVYVYCLSGGRSAAAADWMRSNGFVNVVELSGGINAWRNAGKPLEGKSNAPQMTDAGYRQQLVSDKPVLVDFGAAWCPPCKKMDPVVAALVQEKGAQLKFVKIDAAIHTNLMQQYKVDALPVFIVYKNGQEVWRKQGICTKEELAAALGIE